MQSAIFVAFVCILVPAFCEAFGEEVATRDLVFAVTNPGAGQFAVIESDVEFDAALASNGITPADLRADRPDFGSEVVLLAKRNADVDTCVAIDAVYTNGARTFVVVDGGVWRPELNACSPFLIGSGVNLAAMRRIEGTYVFLDRVTLAPLGADVVE